MRLRTPDDRRHYRGRLWRAVLLRRAGVAPRPRRAAPRRTVPANRPGSPPRKPARPTAAGPHPTGQPSLSWAPRSPRRGPRRGRALDGRGAQRRLGGARRRPAGRHRPGPRSGAPPRRRRAAPARPGDPQSASRSGSPAPARSAAGWPTRSGCSSAALAVLLPLLLLIRRGPADARRRPTRSTAAAGLVGWTVDARGHRRAAAHRPAPGDDVAVDKAGGLLGYGVGGLLRARGDRLGGRAAAGPAASSSACW